jgi:hypothetical protein
MKTLAIFEADPDGWPESPSGVLFRDDSTVGDDTMQVMAVPGASPVPSRFRRSLADPLGRTHTSASGTNALAALNCFV